MNRDPYTAPQSRVADATVGVADRARPAWVWAIAIFFGLSTVWTLLSFALIGSGAIPLNAEAKAYYAGLSALDYALAIAGASLNLCGIVLLFLLRAKAPAFLLAALTIGVVNTLYQVATKNLLSAAGGSGSVGMLIGLLLWGVICAYAYRLRRRGVLR
jgi:hypothetical protein